jgi:hypothetical protein
MLLKRINLTCLAIATVLSGLAQEQTINLGSALNKKVYVNLSEGTTISYDNNTWEFAFDNRAQNAAILVNDANTTEVFYIDNQTDFENLDTTGLSSSLALQNSWTTWESGALNDLANPQDPFDFGWGSYNMSTHTVQGERVFVLKTSNGELKKVLIEDLANNKFYIRYANIDGSNEVNAEIDRTQYAKRRFTYFDFDTNASLNLEPDSTMWDFVFTSYHGSAGVLMNYQVSAKSFERGTQNDWDDIQNLNSGIQSIGKTWYKVNTSNLENIAYQVNARNGTNYWLTITDAQLTSSGDVTFKVGDITSIDNPNKNTNQISFFPNPLIRGNTLTINATSNTNYSIYNTAGVIVENGVLVKGNNNINTSTLSPGVYFLNSNTGKQPIIIY